MIFFISQHFKLFENFDTVKNIKELKNDPRALNEFVSAQQGWIRQLAIQLHRREVEVDDLVQEGNIALLEAMDDYNETQYPEFKIYAYEKVKTGIKNAVRGLLGHNEKIELINIEDRSLSEGNHSFSELIEDPTARIDEKMELRTFDDIFADMFHLLTDKETQVIQQRFGIDRNGGQPKKIKDIANQLGITPESVRLIKNTALEKLRKSPLSKELQEKIRIQSNNYNN